MQYFLIIYVKWPKALCPHVGVMNRNQIKSLIFRVMELSGFTLWVSNVSAASEIFTELFA